MRFSVDPHVTQAPRPNSHTARCFGQAFSWHSALQYRTLRHPEHSFIKRFSALSQVSRASQVSHALTGSTIPEGSGGLWTLSGGRVLSATSLTFGAFWTSGCSGFLVAFLALGGSGEVVVDRWSIFIRSWTNCSTSFLWDSFELLMNTVAQSVSRRRGQSGVEQSV